MKTLKSKLTAEPSLTEKRLEPTEKILYFKRFIKASVIACKGCERTTQKEVLLFKLPVLGGIIFDKTS